MPRFVSPRIDSFIYFLLLFRVIISTPIINSKNQVKPFISGPLKCQPWCQSPQPNRALKIAPIIPATAPIKPTINPINPANKPTINPNKPAPRPIQNGKVKTRMITISTVEVEDERCMPIQVLVQALISKNHSQKHHQTKTAFLN